MSLFWNKLRICHNWRLGFCSGLGVLVAFFFSFLSSLVYLVSLFPFPTHFHMWTFWLALLCDNISPLPFKKQLPLLGTHLFFGSKWPCAGKLLIRPASIAVPCSHRASAVPRVLQSWVSRMRREQSSHCPIANPYQIQEPSQAQTSFKRYHHSLCKIMYNISVKETPPSSPILLTSFHLSDRCSCGVQRWWKQEENQFFYKPSLSALIGFFFCLFLYLI